VEVLKHEEINGSASEEPANIPQSTGNSLLIMPTASICSFPASEALLADPGLVRSSLQLLAGCDGVLSIYQGIDTEGKTGFITAEFTSYKAFKNLTDINTETYNNIIDGLKPAMAGPRQTIHIESKTSPSTAFSAPITGVCQLNIRGEYTTEEIAKVGERTSEVVMKAEGSHNPPAWGEAAQKPGTWGVVVGWDNIEAYTKFREQEAGAKVFSEILSMGEMILHHVKFEKFVA